MTIIIEITTLSRNAPVSRQNVRERPRNRYRVMEAHMNFPMFLAFQLPHVARLITDPEIKLNVKYSR